MVGRTANTQGFGLENIDVQLRPNGTIEANELLQSNFPNIYCSGDVTGPYQFTHTALHQSWYAAVNALFGWFKSFRVDYRVIPWSTFTDPEVARVGLNAQEAEEKQIPHEVTNYGTDDLDRAIADGEGHGLVRVLTEPGTDKILGTIHIYPTLAEANKYAAGAWKKAHAPQRLLDWAGRYHTWMRR